MGPSQFATSKLQEFKWTLQERRQRPVTLYRYQGWVDLLRRYDLEDKYPTLCNGFQRGFKLGIPKISYTYTPENYPSADRITEGYDQIINREFEAKRYIGPLTRDQVKELIGPFQSSPLSIVPKKTPGKFRVVHDFSSPRSSKPVPSINASMDSSDYPSTWSTFQTISFLISNLPEGSQASTRQVSEAYRTIPAYPDQWPGLVVRLRGEDSFAINTHNNFGLASAEGVYGHVADAALDIFRAVGVGPVSKCADDHIFFRIPRTQLSRYNTRRARWRELIETNGGRHTDEGRIWYSGGETDDGDEIEFDEDCSTTFRDFTTRDASPRPQCDKKFAYSDIEIDRLSEALGIPWEPSKTIPFGDEVPFLGFEWRLSTKEVAVPKEKKDAYKDLVDDFLRVRHHTIDDLRELYGTLMHVCLAIPAGRAYLVSVERMMNVLETKDHPSSFHPTTSEVKEDLSWWQRTLSLPRLAREVPGSVLPVNLEAYSDASTEVGIGITIGGQWMGWKLAPGWKSEDRDISWAEAVGFELLANAIVRQLVDTPSTGIRHVVIFGDNGEIVQAWWNAHSKNKAINEVFRRIHNLEAKERVKFHARFVPGVDNPADNISRGKYPQDLPLLPRVNVPAELVPFLVDWNAPRLAGKTRFAVDTTPDPDWTLFNLNTVVVPKASLVHDVEKARRAYKQMKLSGEMHRPSSYTVVCGPALRS